MYLKCLAIFWVHKTSENSEKWQFPRAQVISSEVFVLFDQLTKTSICSWQFTFSERQQILTFGKLQPSSQLFASSAWKMNKGLTTNQLSIDCSLWVSWRSTVLQPHWSRFTDTITESPVRTTLKFHHTNVPLLSFNFDCVTSPSGLARSRCSATRCETTRAG